MLKTIKKVSGKIKILGVTTLTSLDNRALKQIGYKKNVKQLTAINIAWYLNIEASPKKTPQRIRSLLDNCFFVIK